MRLRRRLLIVVTLAAAVVRPTAQAPAEPATVFTNARILTGAGQDGWTFQNGSLTVRSGKVVSAGRESARPGAAAGARDGDVVDLGGRFVVPGFVNAHAHVSDVDGLKPRAYTDANTRRQLGVYARYGITTVFSLGGEQAPAFALRDAQSTASLARARIFVAGEVIAGRTPDEARANVARVAALKPDVIKIRVDDNLGTTTKMAPDVYRAVIDDAHARGLRVAAHIFYLEDARALVDAGVDILAHSVRDRDVDAALLGKMRARGVVYCPTLTREVSAFAYESRPAFFDDPFFVREADRDVVAQLLQPLRQQAMATSTTAQRYKAGLAVAMRNLKAIADAGIMVAMGTDSGAFPERFQGYFEHLEMAMMAQAGLSPAHVLRTATADAAAAMRRDDIGQLAPGRWADFVVLDRNPLTDIANTKSLASVWIAGQRVPAGR